MRVGWIGLGHIGLPMARRVRAAGFEVSLWSRRPLAADAVPVDGASLCPDLADLAASCDVVCTCVSGPADVLDLHRRLLPTARPGTLFVDLSTAAPGTGRQCAQEADSRGTLFVDAPVTGGVAGAGRGTLTAFAGGSAQALDAARPVLQAFCQRIVPCGPPGSGYQVKLVNQVLMVGSLLAVADAAMLTRGAGLDGAALKEPLGGGTGASFLFDAYWLRMLAPEGPASFSLNLLLKDLRLARQEALSLQAPTRLLDAAVAAVEAAVSRHGPDAGLQWLAA
jgi:3-hydroxyisobutyrate dehydrogenase